MRAQWDALIRDFGKVLGAEKQGTAHRGSVAASARALVDWLVESDRLISVSEVTRHDLGDWLAHLIETRSAATANLRYRSVQQFFKFLVAEEEIDRSPKEQMKPPHVPEAPVDMLPVDTLKALKAWAETHMDEVLINREQYDARIL